MNTLLVRLAAPLQSWGHDAKFERRGTGRTPTKSGVIGLLAAALGRRRDEPIDDLTALRFGARTDREGQLLCDYHIAQDSKRNKPYVTQRYYLTDAVFLAGLESDDDAQLKKIAHALRNPAFPLFLGRRSCPPMGKVFLGIRTGKSLLDALRDEPCLVWHFQKEISLRLEMDADEYLTGAYIRRDVPLSFNQTHRQYGFRNVYETKPYSVPPKTIKAKHIMQNDSIDHDPMRELEG
jgi:CRISPR system Cascade subunit CasD